MYSRENVSFLESYAASSRLRLYTGPLFTVRAAPRAQAFQWIAGRRAAAPHDPGRGPLRHRTVCRVAPRPQGRERDRVNQSYEAGVRLVAASGSSARFMLGYFDGVSERGQLWRKPERYVRLGVAIGD